MSTSAGCSDIYDWRFLPRELLLVAYSDIIGISGETLVS